MDNNEFDKFARMHQGISSTTLSRYQSAVDAYINPSIIEERKLNVAQMDVFSRLMMDRIIFLGVQINDDVANIIIAQLLFPAAVDPKADKGKGSPRARLLPGARTMACRLTKKSFERSLNCRPGPRHTNWDATDDRRLKGNGGEINASTDSGMKLTRCCEIFFRWPIMAVQS